MKLRAIITDTLRSRRTAIIVFLSLSTVFLLSLLAVAILSDVNSILNPGGMRVSAVTIEQFRLEVLKQMEAGLAGFVNFAAILLCVFATAGSIPATLERGTIDVLLSKPVSRDEILAGRFLGGVLIAFLNTAYVVLGAWLIISAATGYWDASLLVTIVTVTMNYVVLASVMLVLGIATRSTGGTIAIIFSHVYFIAPILAARGTIAQVISKPALADVLSFLYYPLPKPGEITGIAQTIILHGPVDWMPLWSSALFGAAAYTFAMWLFRKKDF